MEISNHIFLRVMCNLKDRNRVVHSLYGEGHLNMCVRGMLSYYLKQLSHSIKMIQTEI